MGCGQPCIGFYCYLCTCQQCGFGLNNGTCMNSTYGDGKPVTCCECESPLNGGFCLICASRAGNSSACDPNPNSYNDSPNFSDYTPQPQYQTYYCELCGNNAHYGYDCPPQSPFVYNQDPCFNQNFDNNFPQTSPSLPQQYLCCENCGGPHESFQCQPMNQNFYNSNSSGFDQLQPPQYPVIHNPPQETSVEILQAKEDLMKSIQTFLKKFNRISFRETPKVLLLAWEKFFEIQHAKPEDIQELLHKLLKDLQIISEELSEFINCPSWNRPTFYDDDDEEYTIQYREYLENSSKAITPDLPTHLSTILKTESDKLIRSSVENLVPISSESEDFSDIERECDMPINSLLEEFSSELAYIDIIPLRINETDFDPEEEIRLVEKLLYDNSSPRPPKEFNSENSNAVIESFSPSPIPVEGSDSLMEEIDIFLAPDDLM
ncbi:hypothetical protein Tco_1421110 [Tanacetum coccineum]